MALLKAEAEKLSNNMLLSGVVEEIIDREPLFALMPFDYANGKSYDYVRENALSEATFLDPYETIPEGAATFTEVTTKLKILAGDLDIDKFLAGTMSDTNSQLAVQLASKAKGIQRKFKKTLVLGDSGTNAKEFDGVRVLTPAGQTLAAGVNGGAIAFSMLDELKDMVKLGPDILMMRQGTWRAIRGLLRAMGGNTADTVMLDNFGYPVPAFDGTPVVINDFLPGDETQGSSNVTCSIYAMRLNLADGFHGIFGGGPAGVQVENIGTVQTKDSVRFRVKWYAGTALKATHAIARLKGVTNI